MDSPRQAFAFGLGVCRVVPAQEINFLMEQWKRTASGAALYAQMEPLGWSGTEVLNTVWVLLSRAHMPPLDRAVFVLAGKAEPCGERRSPGGWLLDGHPADTQRVVAAANVVLKNLGCNLIAYPKSAPVFCRSTHTVAPAASVLNPAEASP